MSLRSLRPPSSSSSSTSSSSALSGTSTMPGSASPSPSPSPKCSPTFSKCAWAARDLVCFLFVFPFMFTRGYYTDLLDRCQPALEAVSKWGLVDHTICTQPDVGLLRDGFRSFPSGHSSLAFAGLGYLTLYLMGKLHLWNERGYTVRFLPHFMDSLYMMASRRARHGCPSFPCQARHSSPFRERWITDVCERFPPTF